MARYSLKANGEIVLTFSAVEARGLLTFAREGYPRASTFWKGNKIEKTAADRGLQSLQEAVSKMESR